MLKILKNLEHQWITIIYNLYRVIQEKCPNKNEEVKVNKNSINKEAEMKTYCNRVFQEIVWYLLLTFYYTYFNWQILNLK